MATHKLEAYARSNVSLVRPVWESRIDIIHRNEASKVKTKPIVEPTSLDESDQGEVENKPTVETTTLNLKIKESELGYLFFLIINCFCTSYNV